MPTEPILQLRRCLIRPFTEEDVESLAKAANNPKIARWTRNRFPHPYTTDDAKEWISMANSASPVLNFAICKLDSPSVIGGIGLKTLDDIYYRTMEIGYWLSEDVWGQGIATEVVTAFSDWAFARFDPLLLRLEAETFDGNEASGRVLAKAGFAFEGRHKMAAEKWGKVMDTLTYCKFRECNTS
jgi:RimJ/RimL family protein N-acetyltransferase